MKDENNQWNEDLVDNSINSGFILGRGVGFALSNEISLKFSEDLTDKEMEMMV